VVTDMSAILINIGKRRVQRGREPQRFDGWCVTAADLKDLNPAANWSVSRGYSDSTRAAW